MQTPPGDLEFHHAAARIARIMVAIAALGTVGAFLAGGWKWGAGFFLGAMISEINYRGLRAMVERLGPRRPRRRNGLRLLLRYALLGAGAYVILAFTSISLPAVLAGLFVLIAAVIVEVIFELVYARNRTLDHQDL